MVSRNHQTRPSLGGLDQTETKTDQTIPITGLREVYVAQIPSRFPTYMPLPPQLHGALPNKDTPNLIDQVRGRKRRDFSVCIIGRNQFNNIGTDQIQPGQASNRSAHLACSPSASLGCRKIHRPFVPHPFNDLVNNAIGAKSVDIAGLDASKTARIVLAVVSEAAERRSKSGVDVAVVGDQSLLACKPKEAPMGDKGFIRRFAEGWIPGIKDGSEIVWSPPRESRRGTVRLADVGYSLVSRLAKRARSAVTLHEP
ncbi:hypothetical protein EDB80DRAFT_689928 [Ilyonectria destructans]|nr:hypothetical protein EDB80DRAFT_689928 [Ilyonectria destructans]